MAKNTIQKLTTDGNNTYLDAVDRYFCYHNFVRVHQTLKTTPAIKAVIVFQKWKIEDLVDLLGVPAFTK